jgi:Ca-activated chloride channel homolog
MTTQNVERMLTDQPVPPPPVGLLDQIKAEIPDNVEIHPTLSRTAVVIPWHRRRDLRLGVAAVFVVALTAVVSWQLRQSPRIGPGSAEFQDAVLEAIPSPAEIPSTGDEVRDLERTNQGPEGLDGLTGVAPVTETSEEPPQLRETEIAETIEDETPMTPSNQVGESSEQTHSKIREVQLSVEAPRYQQNEVRETVDSDAELTDEMIEQAMERSFEGEITVTGSLIPRADLTALSPVTVKEGPSRSGRPSANWRQRWSSWKGNSKSSAPQATSSGTDLPAPSKAGTEEPNDQPYGDVLFREYGVNPFVDTEDDRFSTFGLEVDTGSYNVIRRFLMDGNLPPREAVRLEEIVNAFDYGDQPPEDGDFALTTEGAPSPFADGPRYKMIRFGVAGRSVSATERPAAILTFVVDVSGSMDQENRLVLVKRALYELLDNLREDDRVGLVVYGSNGEVLLEPSTEHEEIRAAVDRLSAGGSTNAEEGLVLAYGLADRFREDGLINRVILCSDGVANVGRTGPKSILMRIKGFADNGIELTTVGFGMGNYNDVLMEQLADTGDGRYGYVDTLDEAKRLFVEELTGTLMTVGSETKAQVEFNPEVVSRYRLLGYENRDIADERFRDPTVDAGEIGAGHTATAVYEIKLKKKAGRRASHEIATLRVRYRPFGSDDPVEIEHVLRAGDLEQKWKNAPPSLRLATLVAEYGEILKGSYWARTGDMDEVLSRARELAPEFEGDDRVSDWIELVEAAAELMNEAGEENRITD